VPSEIQQNRYDQLIRRVAGIVGPGSKVAEALTELFPTFEVENVPGELLALGGTKLCCGAARNAAVAGQKTRIQLFNPVDSGHIITVTHVAVFAEAVSEFVNHAVRQIPLTTITSLERFRDGRFPTPGRPVGQIRLEFSVAQTDPDQILSIVNTTTLFLDDPNSLAVLPPGSGYEFGCQTNNISLVTAFRWRERPAEQSELNF